MDKYIIVKSVKCKNWKMWIVHPKTWKIVWCIFDNVFWIDYGEWVFKLANFWWKYFYYWIIWRGNNNKMCLMEFWKENDINWIKNNLIDWELEVY